MQQFCFKKGVCKFNLDLDRTKRYCGLQVGGGGGGGGGVVQHRSKEAL